MDRLECLLYNRRFEPAFGPFPTVKVFTIFKAFRNMGGGRFFVKFVKLESYTYMRKVTSIDFVGNLQVKK